MRDLKPGDVRLLPAGLLVMVHVKGEDPTRVATDRRYIVAVDRHGGVQLYGPHRDPSKDRRAREEMLEAGLAKYQLVGPDEAELFVSDELAAELTDLLAPLQIGGTWRDWDGRVDSVTEAAG